MKGKLLKDANPRAYEEWMDKNEKDKDAIRSGSHFRAWWKCSICKYEWEAIVFNRARPNNQRGCPACVNRVITDKNCLSNIRPDLIEEWDSSNKKQPSEYVSGSNYLATWKCKKCKYAWKTSINERVRGRGCASCAGQVANDKNRLSVLNPKALQDWDYEKNLKNQKIILINQIKKFGGNVISANMNGKRSSAVIQTVKVVLNVAVL